MMDVIETHSTDTAILGLEKYVKNIFFFKILSTEQKSLKRFLIKRFTLERR